MKKILIALLILTACHKKAVVEKPKTDFESLMGKDLPAWQYVQTEEDFQNLKFFKGVFETNIPLLNQSFSEHKIPKVIHFIWVGPKPFPRESVENVRSWLAHHPDWTFKFWTDRERPLPHPQMQLCLIQDSYFTKLKSFYHQSENYGEKSDLLRLEILHKEGGVYVDHDVKCFKNFDNLNKAYDLYCGLEVPYPTCLSSSIMPTNNLVGARKGHPVIKKSMEWLQAHWDELEAAYPGRDKDAVINRVAHRTFYTLGRNFIDYGNQRGNCDIALPSFYFNSPKAEWALFAQHQYKGTWFENESEFERNTRKRLMMMSKKINKLLLAVGVLSGLNLLGFGALALFVRRRKLA